MTITLTEEQREAADNLRESMRIFNNAIRMAAYRGLQPFGVWGSASFRRSLWKMTFARAV